MIIIIELTPFSLNQSAETFAGEFVKKGCPMAAIICPSTQTAKL